MDREQWILGFFDESRRALQRSATQNLQALNAAGDMLAQCLQQGNKILACGNGGSAADAQHFAAELTGRFERERPGLAAISLTTDTSALTAIGNDYGFERIFERQVEALGREGDVLLALSTSGNSENILRAQRRAQALGLRVLALTGRDGGAMARELTGDDLELRAASDRTAHIQQVHIVLLHCLCAFIDGEGNR